MLPYVCVWLLLVSTGASEVLLKCGFESEDISSCGLTISQTGGLLWIRHSGPTPTRETGPQSAYRGQYYMYMEADTGNLGQFAVLESVGLRYNGKVCIRFAYFMFGNDVGSLVVMDSGRRANLWQRVGNHHDNWIEASVNANLNRTQIRISAIRANGTVGDIAIDDLTITTGSCTKNETLPFSCSFEEDLCGMVQSNADQFDWSRRKNATLTIGTGPSLAAEGDWFLYTEVSDPRFLQDEAIIVTGYIQHSGTVCLKFQYHMYGEGIRTLIVDIRQNDGGVETVFANNTNLGDMWFTAEILVEDFRTGAQVAFNGSRGNDPFGDIAIDDIHITGGTCDDVNECLANNGGCSHDCSNRERGYICTCPGTHSLASDGHTCVENLVVVEDGDEILIICCAVGGVLIIVIAVIVGVLLRRRKRRMAGTSQENSYVNHAILSEAAEPPASPTGVDPVDVEVLVRAKPVSTAESTQTGNYVDPSYPAERPSRGSLIINDRLNRFHSPVVLSQQVPAPRKNAKEAKPKENDNKAEFIARVKSKKAAGDFEDEFKTLKAIEPQDWSSANKEELKSKNRFKNIFPFNKNRVKLQTLPGDPLSDYINASHVKGFLDKDDFIASHGPTENTVNDFWRMVWEKEAALVVMVTNPVEGGVVKCIKYWPESGDEIMFEDIKVKVVKEDLWPDYIVRVFRVTQDSKTRTVRQFHFKSWPDHGVPDDPTAILAFHKKVVKNIVPRKPTVIHCSAGVGRTGTLIAIDYLLKQAECGEEIDVFKCVTRLRDQRMHMVQTQIQYEFIHDALVEEFLVGDTAIPTWAFTQQWEGVEDSAGKQFTLLESLKPAYTNDDRAMALSPENQAKNRNVDIVPLMRSQVLLAGDYINAVFVNSYHYKNAFIATQQPLETTTADFWRMIYDFECQTVILLGEKIAYLFPEPLEGEAKIGNYRIVQESVTDASADSPYNISLLTVGKREGNQKFMTYEVSCRVIEVSCTEPRDLTYPSLLQLYTTVQWKEKVENQAPTVFVSRDGVQFCDITIATFAMFEMMSLEQEVDVFHIVNQIKASRPEFIQSQEDYLLLYRIAGEYIKQYGTYSNLS